MRGGRTKLGSLVARASAAAVAALLVSCGSDTPTTSVPPVGPPTIVTTTSTSTTTSTTPPTTTTEAPPPAPPPTTTAAPQPEVVVEPTVPDRARTAPAARCVVRLHGKGGNGAGTTTSAGGWLEVHPRGNAPGWGGYQWLYYPESSYASGVAIVGRAIADNGCTAVVVDGFSNGGAFAAKLACRGETFGGTVVGVVVDDPVPDHGTAQCSPLVPVALYWTGGLASTATPGWACAQADWTCEGGETIGIAATSANLGVPAKQSVNSGHSPYANPPELRAWLG